MAAMASQAVQSAAATAKPIPGRLMRFFARYPPATYSAFATGQKIPTLKQRVAMDSKPLSATTLPTSIPGEDPIPIPTEAADAQTPPSPTQTDSTEPPSNSFPPSPFLPRKDHTTGRWHGAKLGLRIQADLFKLARASGVEELLPPSIKSSEYKQRRALERGLAVKGTGEGQSVKGHKWERQIAVTMEKRRKAMEEMPEMIRLWKQRGHGRGWRKYPK